MCVLSIAIVLYYTSPFLACWFYLYYLVFFVLIHDYTLRITSSSSRNFSYYNYISIWPYYSFEIDTQDKINNGSLMHSNYLLLPGWMSLHVTVIVYTTLCIVSNIDAIQQCGLADLSRTTPCLLSQLLHRLYPPLGKTTSVLGQMSS